MNKRYSIHRLRDKSILTTIQNSSQFPARILPGKGANCTQKSCVHLSDTVLFDTIDAPTNKMIFSFCEAIDCQNSVPR